MGKWERVRLGGHIEQIRGVSYKPEDASETPDTVHMPILRAHNIQDDGLNAVNLIYINKKKIKPNQYIKKGDIVICASSGSKDLVGKAAQAKEDMSVSFGAFCKVVRPKSSIKSNFLNHYFSSPFYRKRISELSAGANINNLRNEHIDDLEISLPPLPVQRQIADVLDRASTLIGKRKAQIGKLDLLIKSQFIEIFGDPMINSKELPSITLEKLALLKAGKNVTANNIYELSDIYRYPCYGGNGIRGYVDKYSHDGNYPLIGRQGALCGNVQFASGRFFPTEHAIVVNPLKRYEPRWMYYTLKYMNLNRLQTGAAQPGLNIDILNQVNIPIPSNADQDQFADFVQQVEAQKALLQQSLIKLELNYKSLMQKCFRGDIF